MTQARDLRPLPTPRVTLPALSFVRLSLLAMLLLAVASWFTVLGSDRLQAEGFFNGETLDRAARFLGDLAGAGSGSTPAFLQSSQWADKAVLALETLAMSVLGIGIAAVLALALFMFGARNIMLGELSPYGSAPSTLLFGLVRAFFTLTRSIPELVWALLLVFAFTPGILPGALALGIHNAGVLGRLGAEVVEGLDPRPMRALRAAGAGRLQVLVYGVLPEALPRCVTYLFYRWEVVIRTTVVVGFVAAGGLGREFRLAMSLFQYTEVTLILFWYIIIVLFVDVTASYLRRLAE